MAGPEMSGMASGMNGMKKVRTGEAGRAATER
jgi:hypothetical protein